MGKPRYVSSKSIHLLRALLPSWRFFDDAVPAPKLFHRVRLSEGPFGPWQPTLTPQPRSILSFFINAQGNLHLAAQSIVEQLVNDIEDLPDDQTQSFLDWPSYQLARALVRQTICHSAKGFQFKVSINGQDTLISLSHEV